MNHESLRELVEQIRAASPELGARAEQELLREVRVAPTLVKYADPNQYEMDTRRALRQVAAELMGDLPVARGAGSRPAGRRAARGGTGGYPDLRALSLFLPADSPGGGGGRGRIRREIIDMGLRRRGSHDEMLRAFCAGQQFRFDILMDIGGFRDMHRHRRCVQIGQEFTTKHGYDAPEELEAAGVQRKLRCCDAADRERCRAIGVAGRAGSAGEFAICDPAGFSEADSVQDGFC